VPCSTIERGDPSRYEQYKGGKMDVKKKDEQNEESYEKKRQNQVIKDKYLEKGRKVVLK
jgi:hypothetical protein